jgi:hypothetical protein
MAKYLTALGAGWPRGLSKPAATKTGMACGAKPRNQAASSDFKRAGKFRRFRNCNCCELIELSGRTSRLCSKTGCILPRQNCPFADWTPPIITQHAGFSNHAMARNEIYQWVLSHGRPHGTSGSRLIHGCGQASITHQGTMLNLQQCPPHTHLKRSASNEGTQRSWRISNGGSLENAIGQLAGSGVVPLQTRSRPSRFHLR